MASNSAKKTRPSEDLKQFVARINQVNKKRSGNHMRFRWLTRKRE